LVSVKPLIEETLLVSVSRVPLWIARLPWKSTPSTVSVPPPLKMIDDPAPAHA